MLELTVELLKGKIKREIFSCRSPLTSHPYQTHFSVFTVMLASSFLIQFAQKMNICYLHKLTLKSKDFYYSDKKGLQKPYKKKVHKY